MKFLDYKHGDKWAIWEFRAEGTGYPDEEVYNRIQHYPWPDHHPPPFALIPSIMASVRNWLKGPEAENGRVAVVHCKAGKGRSGTIATSYLISEEQWSVEEAMQRFTDRRMRSGFGPGLSIPSQIRWIKYVDWWSKHDKIYVERPIEILEIHVWGLRDGVKVDIEGYVDEGKVIKRFHSFTREERIVVDDAASEAENSEVINPSLDRRSQSTGHTKPRPAGTDFARAETARLSKSNTNDKAEVAAALFRPKEKVIVPTSDVNIDFERRNKAKYGLTMVTAVAHVWFNAYFESQCPHNKANLDQPSESTNDKAEPCDLKNPPLSGVFSTNWDAMDGIKGSSRKGTRAFDRMSVVWRAASSSTDPAPSTETEPNATLPKLITQPTLGAPVEQTGPSDKDASSRLLSPDSPKITKNLGLRIESPQSTDISRSNSPASADVEKVDDDIAEKGLRPFLSANSEPQDDSESETVPDGNLVDAKSGLHKEDQKHAQSSSEQALSAQDHPKA